MTEKQRTALLLAASSEHVLICDSDPMFGVHPRTIRALSKSGWIIADSLDPNITPHSLSNHQLEELDFHITLDGWAALGLNPAPQQNSTTAEDLLLNLVNILSPELEFYSRKNDDLPPICVEENHLGESSWLDLSSVLLITRYNRFDQNLVVELQVAADITALQLGISPESSEISVDRIGSWVVISDGEIEIGELDLEHDSEDFLSEEEADY